MKTQTSAQRHREGELQATLEYVNSLGISARDVYLYWWLMTEKEGMTKFSKLEEFERGTPPIENLHDMILSSREYDMEYCEEYVTIEYEYLIELCDGLGLSGVTP